jgi:molecular chaperone DnaJ
MAQNYYLILGVDADATPDQIKSAYRYQAKKLHPDCCPGSSQPFLDVQEAYEVLSDPARRESYDERLAAARSSRACASYPRSQGWPAPVEPLIPTDHDVGSADKYVHPASRWSYGPWQEPTVRTRPRDVEAEELAVRIPLSPSQARQGGRVQLALPAEETCPACGGHGGSAFWPCGHCGGRGTVLYEHPLTVTFPAGIAHGTVARLPLDSVGFPGAALRVEFRIVKSSLRW